MHFEEITYVHKQWSNQEAETLAVSNMGVIDRVGLKDVTKALLSLASLLLEHVDLWECPGEIPLNDALVGGVLEQELCVHGFQVS